MSIRLVVSITAAPGKGGELAQAYKPRCLQVMQEPGCEQFEVFQSVVNPDRLALLERWTDQAALDAHLKVNQTRPPLPEGLRVGRGHIKKCQMVDALEVRLALAFEGGSALFIDQP